jgi:uncharacterized protein (DUF3820 family)
MTIDFNDAPSVNQNLVPFGKYKGQPLEILRQDPGYLEWLAAQDWFRKQYAWLYSMLVTAPTETPEHNRYQALFLDETFAAAVYDVAIPGKRKQNAEYKRRQLEDHAKYLREQVDYFSRNYSGQAIQREHHQVQLNDVQEELAAPDVLPRVFVTFEVMIAGRGGAADVHISTDPNPPCYPNRSDARIEIKPSMGDDYPAVLRQMQASFCNVLYLVSYSGEGATLDQVKQIFKASGINVLMHGDFQHQSKGKP